MDYGSQDPVGADVKGGKYELGLNNFREDAHTRTYIVSDPEADAMKLKNLPAKNAILVQQDFDARSSSK